MAVRKPTIHFSPAIPPRNNRSFDWFVIGEKGKTETPGGESAAVEGCCTKLKCLSKSLIINELLVEATGVELIVVLTARKLLIPRSATRAKKAPLPDPLYVYCTKNTVALESRRPLIATTVSHGFAGLDQKKTPSFLRYPRPARNFRLARYSGGIERSSVA